MNKRDKKIRNIKCQGVNQGYREDRMIKRILPSSPPPPPPLRVHQFFTKLRATSKFKAA
jgi:hypothetical protein